jgi:hypothetical protein
MLSTILSQIKNRFFDFSGKPDKEDKAAAGYILAALNWFRSSLLPEGGSAAKYGMMTHSFTQGYPMATANWVPVLTRINQYYPTVFSQVFSDRDISRELVSWVLRTQRRDGTFPAGYGDYMNQPPKVFNNGMIMHGLLDYYNDSGGQHELVEACMKSADWLLKVQSPDGSWRQFTVHQLSSNTVSAAALLRLASITGNEAYKQAGERNIQFALELQSDNGYFKGNGFDSSPHAYTLTIAYAIGGLLEAGILEGNKEWQQAALRGLIPVLNTVSKDGFLAGELDENFQSASSFTCLPGNCLLAILSYKLASLTGNPDLKTKADLLTNYVKKRQMVSKIPGVSGGITGSWPVSGNYCSYEVTSWGVRYFTEAVMMQDPQP